MQQRTIKHVVSCFGVGVHSGRPASISLYPAEVDTGVTFIRTDISGSDNEIKATYEKVCKTKLGTTIGNKDGVQVATIEHLMAALWGCRIDNVRIEVDGEEIPIMDGSAEPFVFMIECAGVKEQEKPRKYIEILKEMSIQDGDAKIVISPDSYFSIDMSIQFENNIISTQNYHFSEKDKSFKHDLSRARTFGFKHEADMLQKAGLAKGASLENVIVIEGDQVLNKDGLRYQNEFVRHKLLDLIGDFYLAGAPIRGHISTYKPGHTINNKLLHKMFSDKDAWRMVDGL